jgi:Alkylmercury lyase
MSTASPSHLHYLIIRNLLDTGKCPSNAELRQALCVTDTVLAETLQELEAAHGIVLHPGSLRPWVIHPFSLTPTATWVETRDRGWWAPCIWCALGIATIAGGDITIHSRLGGERDPLSIPVKDGLPISPEEYCVHFAIRPAEAWNNVHAHCAMLLPFRAESDVHRWAERHGLPVGEIVPLSQTADLARNWYGRHADSEWRKWTIDEAQAIFSSVGLSSGFWNLGRGQGRF